MARKRVTKTAEKEVEVLEKVTKEAPAETSTVETGGKTAEEEPTKAVKAVNDNANNSNMDLHKYVSETIVLSSLVFVEFCETLRVAKYS